MIRMTTHQHIVDILEKGPITLSMLHKKTRLAKGGITSRISELRKKGYDIQCSNGKYQLSDNTSSDRKIEDWIAKNHRFGLVVDYNKLSTDLNLPIDDIKKGMQKLFYKYRIIQITNHSAVVRNKN